MKHAPRMPAALELAERILSRIGAPSLAEAICGDLQETWPKVQARWGTSAAWVWLASEVSRSAAWLVWKRLTAGFGGRREISHMDHWTEAAKRTAAILGAVACLPAVLLVVGGLLQSEASTPDLRSLVERTVFNPDLAGFRLLIHPGAVLGGLVLATSLNLLPLLRLGLERRPGAWVGSVALRVRLVHLAVSGAAIGLLAVILGYGFVENYRIVPTHTSQLAPVVGAIRPADDSGTLWLHSTELLPEGTEGWSLRLVSPLPTP